MDNAKRLPAHTVSDFRTPTSSPKASTTLAFDIAGKIARNELTNGSSLPAESDLVADYAVSRAVVREAMRLLEHDGLVSIRRGATGGARVRTPGTATSARYVGLLLQMMGTTLMDLDVTLLAMEREAVRLVALGRPADGLKRLHAAFAVGQQEPLRAEDLNAFHDALGPATGNRVLGALFEVIAGIRARHSLAAVARSSRPDEVDRDLAKAHAFHRRVLHLIEAGEAEVAAERWHRHAQVAARALAQDPARSVLDLFQSGLAAMEWEVGSDDAEQRPRLPKGSDVVAGDFRRRIVTGRLSEGQSLPTEADIMLQFGLSRPPVREAVRVLEAEGLVIPKQGSHRGGTVRRPRVAIAAGQLALVLEHRGATVGELIDAQLVLGRVAARALDPHRSGAVLDTASSDVSSTDQLTGFLAVHRILIQATGNTTLRCLDDLLGELLRRHRSSVQESTRRGRAARQRVQDAQEAAIALSGDHADAVPIERLRSTWLDAEQALATGLAASLSPAEPLRVFSDRPS